MQLKERIRSQADSGDPEQKSKSVKYAIFIIAQLTKIIERDILYTSREIH
jgi:hypothetical protein